MCSKEGCTACSGGPGDPAPRRQPTANCHGTPALSGPRLPHGRLPFHIALQGKIKVEQLDLADLSGTKASADQLTASHCHVCKPTFPLLLQGKISVQQLDLADLSSIKAAADQLSASLPRLDLLILNAGVMACPQGRTKDGFEMQVGHPLPASCSFAYSFGCSISWLSVNGSGCTQAAWGRARRGAPGTALRCRWVEVRCVEGH